MLPVCFWISAKHLGDFHPPMQRDGRGFDALGGHGRLQFPADFAQDPLRFLVRQQRPRRGQQVEHRRPKPNQALLGCLAFLGGIGIKLADEPCDLGLEGLGSGGLAACRLARQHAADDEIGR